jgi:hypothetical protein
LNNHLKLKRKSYIHEDFNEVTFCGGPDRRGAAYFRVCG